jgi:hypothetical protein
MEKLEVRFESSEPEKLDVGQRSSVLKKLHEVLKVYAWRSYM